MAIPIDLKLVSGDAVSIQATVKFDEDGGTSFWALPLNGFGSGIRVERANARIDAMVIRRGDEVRAAEAVLLTDNGSEAPEHLWPYGTVVAVSGDTAWIEWPVGASLEPIASLRRIRTWQQVEDLEPRPGEAQLAAEIEPAPADAETPAAFPNFLPEVTSDALAVTSEA